MRCSRLLVTVAAVSLMACATPVGPGAPVDPSQLFPPALRAEAFEVEVRGDSAVVVATPNGAADAYLNTEDVALVFDQVAWTPVDAYGHRRLAITVHLRNGSARALAASPSETAAAGVDDQLLIIPLEVWVPETPGGVSVDGGTEMTIEMPNQGEVKLSEDWSGQPAPFFGARGACYRPSLSCRPFESLAAPLLPAATSESRELSFDIDATVHRLRFRVLLAGRPGNS